MNKNEYDRLVELGYVEAGTLVIKVDDINTINLTEEQVKQEAAKQGTRYDKGVVIIDKNGKGKKVSSLMFGYNKQNIQLADGSFANADELLVAMQNAISSLDKGTIIVSKKGEYLDPEALIKVVDDVAGKIKIGQRSSKVSNQDTRTWSVESAQSDVEHKKGVVFLGNDGIDLKTGDYVSVDELLTALNDYVILKPNVKEEQENITPVTNRPKVVRVVRKYKDKLARILAVSAAAVVLLSGIRVKDNVKNIDVPVEVKEQIVHMIENNELDYTILDQDTEHIYESIVDAVRRTTLGTKIGDSVELEAGDVLYENSLLGGKKAIIGNGKRQPGMYQISGVSIVCDGKMYEWHVDKYVNEPGFDLGKFITEACEKNNLDIDNVQIRFHMGSSANNTRTGWIDSSSLFKEGRVEQQVIGEQTSIAATYTGVENNFDGSTLTFTTAGGLVTINVLDQNGNLLQPGSKVIGSDGNEYVIGNLNVETKTEEQASTVTKTVIEQQQVVDGKKVTWSIQDCSLAIGLLPAVGAIASAVATKKKNDEAKNNPKLFEFDNEKEYIEFKNNFEAAKAKYEKKSGFAKTMKRLFHREELDLMQALTPEQVQELYSILINWNSPDYKYSTGDKFEFKDGKIFVHSKDGVMDLTGVVMPAIAKIGAENKVEAEGKLKEEDQNGICK